MGTWLGIFVFLYLKDKHDPFWFLIIRRMATSAPWENCDVCSGVAVSSEHAHAHTHSLTVTLIPHIIGRNCPSWLSLLDSVY